MIDAEEVCLFGSLLQNTFSPIYLTTIPSRDIAVCEEYMRKSNTPTPHPTQKNTDRLPQLGQA